MSNENSKGGITSLVLDNEEYDEEKATEIPKSISKKRKTVATTATKEATQNPNETTSDSKKATKEENNETPSSKDNEHEARLQSRIARLTAELERVRKGELRRASSAASVASMSLHQPLLPNIQDNTQRIPNNSTDTPNNSTDNNSSSSTRHMEPLETYDPDPLEVYDESSLPLQEHSNQHPAHLRMWLLATYRLLTCHGFSWNSSSTWSIRKVLALCAAFLLTILSTEELVHEANHHLHHSHHHNASPPPTPPPKYPPPGPQPEPLPPAMTRADHVASCAARLSSSNTFFSDVTSSRLLAVEWFVIGPGRSISDIPQTSQQCEDPKSLFAHLYSLMVLQHSLNITLPSWTTTTPDLTFTSMSDICSHYHCLTCNKDKTSVTSINLANMLPPYELTGTIPPEIGLLSTLERIELNSNDQLHGSIPSEMGKLSNLQYLHLHYTSLSGSIPSDLGKLTSLKELFVEHDKLHGTMPQSICQLRTTTTKKEKKGVLELIQADCGGDEPKLECATDCCTQCHK